MKTILLRLSLTLLLTVSNFMVYSTVGGPTYIEILGIEAESNIIYFVETNWSECDCHPTLYKYYIDTDSLAQIENWVSKYDYNKKEERHKVIRDKGLDKLTPISKVNSFKHGLYSFNWQSPVMQYNYGMMKDTLNYPFRLEFGERYFEYILCLNRDNKLIIDKYEVNNNFGFLLCRFKGKCREGNTLDKVIIFKTDGQIILSRELNINDKLKPKN